MGFMLYDFEHWTIDLIEFFEDSLINPLDTDEASNVEDHIENAVNFLKRKLRREFMHTLNQQEMDFIYKVARHAWGSFVKETRAHAAASKKGQRRRK